MIVTVIGAALLQAAAAVATPAPFTSGPAKPASPTAAPVGDTYALALSDSSRAILVDLTTFKAKGSTKTFTTVQIFPAPKSYDQNRTVFDYEVISQVIKCGVETHTILKNQQFVMSDGTLVNTSPVSEYGDPIVLDTYPFKLMQFVCGERLTDKTRQLTAKTDLDLAQRIRASYGNLIGY